jgi:hypothetical protein
MRRCAFRSLAFAALMFGSACGHGDSAASPPPPPAPAAASTAANLDEAAASVRPSPADGVPDDIPIPTGLRSTSVTSPSPGALVVLLTGDLDPEAVATDFAEGLKRSGWSIDQSRTTGSDLGLLAHKEQRMASVVVTRLSGRLHVELGVWAPH